MKLVEVELVGGPFCGDTTKADLHDKPLLFVNDPQQERAELYVLQTDDLDSYHFAIYEGHRG